MSENRKALKIVSLIQFVVAIAVLVVAFVAAPASGEGGIVADMPWLGKALCVAGAILGLACCAGGIRGANRPSALGSHNVVSILALVAGIGACAVMAMAGTTVVAAAPAASAILALVGLILDGKVRKELDR